MKIKILIITLILSINTNAQPTIQWQKCLGGTSFEGATSIQQTTDGCYIVSGYASSSDGAVTGLHGLVSMDYWIVKIDSLGAIKWQKCLGGTDIELARSIQQTTDGGYIVAGKAWSNNGDVTGNHGGSDYWVVKLDSIGIIQWQKCLGGNAYEEASSIKQTTDGGYIVAGNSSSNNGDVTGNHGGGDYWIVKLDNIGDIEWQKCLGGKDEESAASIQQTTEGGYIVAGYSKSNDGDVTGLHGTADYWIVKLDIVGEIEWQKCLGGTIAQLASSIQQTTEGGYIVAGISFSNDGDVTGNHGGGDYWIVKLDKVGAIQWQKCLGGTSQDNASSIQQTADKGFIVAGNSSSNDVNVIGNKGGGDYWIVKLDSIGAIQWQKCLGGTDEESATSIQQTNDGGCIVVGDSKSKDGDVTGNHTYRDYWIVKLSPRIGGGVGIKEPLIEENSISIFPNPANNQLTIYSSVVLDKEVTISVINVFGETVQTEIIVGSGNEQLMIKNLTAGIYFLQFKTKNGTVVKRFIKEF
jgi:predicted NUDIX family NTP pyrophosphohydrolase